MKKLDLNRPPVLPTIGEFALFNPLSCEEAREIYRQRILYGPIGLMQLKAHLIDDKLDHRPGCPVTNSANLKEVNRLLEAD